MKPGFFSRPISIYLSLLIVFVGSFLAYLVQTDYGSVKVKDIRFAGDQGNVLSAKLFVPANLNPEKQHPAVLTMHGYINSREVQDAFNIEFARRGYVVLAMDMQGHGYSEQTAYEVTSRGAISGLSYLRNLGFVDKDKIAVEGHSMGGWSTLAAAVAHPDWVNTVIQAGSSTETYGAGEVTADTPFNYAVIYGKYDEFAKLMWEVPQAKQIVNTDKLKKVFGVEEAIKPATLYGSFEDKSARKLYMPNETHPFNHWSVESVSYAVEFLQQAIPAPNPIKSSNQIWDQKEYSTLIAMVGGLMFLLSAGANLLRTSYFKPVAAPLPEAKGFKTKWPWLIGGIIATAIPALSFFKFQEWGTAWFPVNGFWPQSLTNGFVIWVLFNAIIALVLFALWHYTSNKKEGGTAYHYGLSYSEKGFSLGCSAICRTIALAVITVGSFFLLTLLADAIFLVDFRIWVIAFKPMDWPHFLLMLQYIVPFLIFFIVNGLVLHGQFRLKEGATERVTAWKWFLANAAVNTLGIIVLIAIQYYPLFTAEEFDINNALLSIVAFQFVFINILAALISTFFYRKTGKLFAGALINAILVTWYITAGQAVQYGGQEASTGASIAVTVIGLVLLIIPLFIKSKSTK